MSHPLKIEAGARRHPVTGVWWERQLVPVALKMSAQARHIIKRERIVGIEELLTWHIARIHEDPAASMQKLARIESARIHVLKDALCDDMWRAFGCLRGVKV